MSFYANFRESQNPQYLMKSQPSIYSWKQNPFVSYPIIDSNIAGVNKKQVQFIVQKEQTKQDKPYEYNYQSCCNISVPVSQQYQQTREVIFSP
jgi:hypothetical protein